MPPAKVTSSQVYEETPFGTLALSRNLPTVARLFGYETGHNNRLFLGRTRVPKARVDLFAEFIQAQPLQRPLMGWVSVFHVLALSDQTPDKSRLHRYVIERTGHAEDIHFELITQHNGNDLEREDYHTEGSVLHRATCIPDMLAVALLNAAG